MKVLKYGIPLSVGPSRDFSPQFAGIHASRSIKWIMRVLLLFISLIVIAVGFRIVIGLVLKEAPHVSAADGEILLEHALKLHHGAIVVDGHNDIATWILDFGFDLGMNGDEHVGLSSDFDGGVFFPAGLKDVGDLPNITVEHVRRGYSDEDIRKIPGGNVLRVLDEVERVAAQLSGI